MSTVLVDPDRRIAHVGAGARWRDVLAAAAPFGLAPLSGSSPDVGVAGYMLGGGLSRLSRRYGFAADSLLRAELVTADGQLVTASPRHHPDLFWALRGGGGNFGVVTRLTLRVHALPETFGAINIEVKATSDAAFRKLIGLTLDFTARTLIGPHWGEQIRFLRGNRLQVSMVCQGLARSEAVAAWQPFFDALDASPQAFDLAFSPLRIVTTDARSFWAPSFVKRLLGFMKRDDRPGAPETHVFWAGDQGQAGQVLHGYESLWLPQALLGEGQRGALAEALFAATRHWGVSLHLN
jgi:hypothetical protein